MTGSDILIHQIYEIKVKGYLPPDWTDWFDGMTLHPDAECAETTLRGPVVDQAALYGVLIKVRDLGLTLLSVNPVSSVNNTEPWLSPTRASALEQPGRES